MERRETNKPEDYCKREAVKREKELWSGQIEKESWRAVLDEQVGETGLWEAEWVTEMKMTAEQVTRQQQVGRRT